MFFDRFINNKLKQQVGINKRKIYFIIASNWGSYIMCGYQMSDQLKKMGIDTEILNIYKEPKRVKSLKDSVIVFVKETPKTYHKVVHKLTKRNNILIWVPVDGFSDCKDEKAIKMFDGVVVPNAQCKIDWSSYFHKNCICEVLYLHWDLRCVFNQAKKYMLVYAGIILPGNISEEYLDKIKGLNTITINTADPVKQKNIFKQAIEYNCHFSVRNGNLEDFSYKPNSKLSFAAGTNSNIILSRDQSNIELLDQAYPYYTDSNIDNVMKTVEYSRDTYGSKIWNDALDMMREVRERTSIERICKDFLEYLERFQ